jgi:hypothetical protein
LPQGMVQFAAAGDMHLSRRRASRKQWYREWR